LFHALDEPVDVTNLQPDARFLGPAVVDAFQEIIEEALLQETPVIGVKVSPVL
jgi:hypothetical protein